MLTGHRNRLEPPAPPPPPAGLLASSSPNPASLAESTVTMEALTPIVAEAVERWSSALAISGNTMALDQVQFKISDLPGALLGQTIGNTVTIDTDGGGYGWFIDPTPADNMEFSRRTATGELFAVASSPAFGRMDLLTAVMHELGHELGFEHQPQGIMEPTLKTGERLNPTDLSASAQVTPRLANPDPVRNDTQPVPAPQRRFQVFDEAKGEFFRPGVGLPLSGYRDLKFHPAPWDGREVHEGDNGEDWIVDYHPRKLHG